MQTTLFKKYLNDFFNFHEHQKNLILSIGFSQKTKNQLFFPRKQLKDNSKALEQNSQSNFIKRLINYKLTQTLYEQQK